MNSSPVQAKIAALTVFIFFSMIIPSGAESTVRTIVILPFTNTDTSEYEYDYLQDQIPTYFYAILKDIPGYASVSHYEIKKFEDGYIYRVKNFDKESLSRIADKYGARFIIRGDYKVSDGKLLAYCIVTDTADWRSDTKFLDGKIRIPITYTLDELFLPIIKDLTGYILETTVLSVTPDLPCSLYIDDEYFGEAPMRVRLLKGEHLVAIKYRTEDKEESISQKTVTLSPSVDLSIDIKVFVRLSVKAEKECEVFVDGVSVGTTPVDKKLYTGREYDIKTVYKAPDGKEITALDRVISTVEYAYMADPVIEFNLPAKASVAISESRYELSCGLDSGNPESLPCTFGNLEPGAFRIEVFIDDPAWKRKWVFFETSRVLYPFEAVTIDMKSFSYEKQFAYCAVPCLPQFYNHEPGKGALLLSFLTGSLLMCGIGAIAGSVYYPEYMNIKTTFEAGGLGSEYTRAKVDAAYLPVATCNGLITAGFITGIAAYLLSAADGILSMNRLDELLDRR